MGRNNIKAPCHWRARRGYAPPVMDDEPTTWPSGGFYAPMPFSIITHPILFASKLIPFAYGGLTFPPGPAQACHGGPLSALLPYRAPSPSLTATDTDEEDSSCRGGSDTSSFSSSSKESLVAKHPGIKLPGGLHEGTSYLYTGRPCHVHIIDCSSISLSRLVAAHKSARKFQFTRHVVMDNSTVDQLMEALGGGLKASLTQAWEWGDGKWKAGSKVKYGDERAGQRLSEMGWSDAGCRERPPVWLYFQK